MNTFIKVTAVIALLLGGLGTYLGFQHEPTAIPKASFGATTPIGGITYYLAGAGITSSQNTITLTSFTTPDGRPITTSMLGGIQYCAIEPQTQAKLEDCSFTGVTQNANGTATLTGVQRGLDFVSPYAASSTLAYSHSGGAAFILTNTAGFYGQQFAFVNNPESIYGVWTFASTAPPAYDYNPNFTLLGSTTLASIGYVASTSYAGTVNANTSTKGIVQIATALQSASSTATGSTGALLALTSSNSTDTPQAACATGYTLAGAGCNIIADLTGHIKQAWLNFAQLFTFTGGLTSTATTTIAASSTTTAPVVFNTIPYAWSNLQGASSTALETDGVGDLSWEPVAHGYASGTVSTTTNYTGPIVINHGLGAIPRLIMVQYTSSADAMGSGSASISATGSVSNQQSNSTGLGSSQYSCIGGSSSAIANFSYGSGCGTSNSVTLSAVNSTSFTLTWSGSSGYNTNLTWEAYY